MNSRGGSINNARGSAPLRTSMIPIIPISDNRAIAVLRDTTFILSPLEKDVLTSCRDLGTWDGHLQTMVNRFGIDYDKAGSIVKDLCARGLLATIEPINETAAADHLPHAHAYGRLENISIISQDRPTALEECLLSYVENCLSFGHLDVCITICDDSISSSCLHAGRQLARSVASRYPIKIRYMDTQSRERFCNALEGMGIPEDICKYGLLPQEGQMSVGANRNCTVLDNIDRLCLLADDDTSARCAVLRNASTGLTVGGHDDPRKVTFFGTRQQVLDCGLWQEVDILTQHEQLLGKSIKDQMRGTPNNIKFQDTCGHVLSAANEQPTVLYTMPGKIGDCGREFDSWVAGTLAAGGIEPECIVQRLFAYNVVPREILEISQYASIVHDVGCMAMVIGLDGSASLPPFAPNFRNEDGVFASLIRCSLPDGLVGIPNYAAFHNAASSKVYSSDHETRFSDLVIAIVNTYPRLYRDPISSQMAIGQWVVQFSSQPLQDFREAIASLLTDYYLCPLRQLDHFNSASGWVSGAASDLIDRHRDGLLKLIVNRKDHLPSEFRARGETAWSCVQDNLRRFGQMLMWWDNIRQATRELHRQGIFMSSLR